MYRITLHSYMHYHHCILTCITIIWHSYMYYCHVAFLHALPSHRILTCVTTILHRILTCVAIILHLRSFIQCMHSIFTRKAHFISSVQKISNCLLDACSELEGCLRGL